jgi:hypothetical protein
MLWPASSENITLLMPKLSRKLFAISASTLELKIFIVDKLSIRPY